MVNITFLGEAKQQKGIWANWEYSNFKVQSTKCFFSWISLEFLKQCEKHIVSQNVFQTFGCYSVTKSCATLCNSMDSSTPGSSVLHYLPEFAQIHVLWVSDVIQPSHPLSAPFPSALNLSQHQGLFQWVGCLYQVVCFYQALIFAYKLLSPQ